MIIASILTIFQYFVSGYIILNFTKLEFGIIKRTILSFTLSQILNFAFIFILTYFHRYNRESLYLILGIESLLLLYIYFKGPNQYVQKKAREDYNRILEVSDLPLGKLAVISALISLIIVVFLMINNVGEIFGGWDPVFSWNKWAVAFYNNNLPTGIRHYPQLIPANWSVAYVLLGQPLQFLPKAIMPLYLLFILISIIDIALRERSVGIMFGVFITLCIFLSARVSFEGYVDTPVAFFSFQSLYMLYLASKEDDKKKGFTYLLLAILISAGAAVTKQAGLYVLVLCPVFCYVILKKKNQSVVTNLKLFLSYLLFVIVIVLPFYVYANQQIANGKSVSEIAWVTNGIYGNKTLLQRLIDAWGLLGKLIRIPYLIYPLTGVFIYSLTDKKLQPISFSFTIPYFFIWAFYFSYDLRNFSIIYPLIGISVGIGIYMCLQLALKKASQKRLQNIIISTAIVVGIFFILQGDKKYTIKYYQDVHTKLEKQVCLPTLNELIYKYQYQHGIVGNIATDYPILEYLPELKKYAVQYSSASLSLTDIKYVLIRENDYNKNTINKLLADVKSNKAQLIFYYSDINDYKYYNYYRYYFFKIR